MSIDRLFLGLSYFAFLRNFWYFSSRSALDPDGEEGGDESDEVIPDTDEEPEAEEDVATPAVALPSPKVTVLDSSDDDDLLTKVGSFGDLLFIL